MTDVYKREAERDITSQIHSKSGLDRRLFAILDELGIPYGASL